MTSTDPRRRQVSGRGIPLPGNDIDTDRIIPARFLKEVTFESMSEHAFEDARQRDAEHPFNQKVYQGAAVLVVGQNFGCGSSREQAPQALMRWGIRAIVGGSFGDIFFGNCVVLGIPCLVATAGLMLFCFTCESLIPFCLATAGQSRMDRSPSATPRFLPSRSDSALMPRLLRAMMA